MVRGVGGNIGPDLSMIGKKASKENLFESILLPSKAIADQYLQWKVNTLDEKSVTGLLVAETATSDHAPRRQRQGPHLRDQGPRRAEAEEPGLDHAGQPRRGADRGRADRPGRVHDDAQDGVAVAGSVVGDGPVHPAGRNEGLGHDYGPEKAAFDPKATFPEWNGPSSGRRRRTWRGARSARTRRATSTSRPSTATRGQSDFVSACRIESPVEQDARCLLGSDDGVNLYVNGELRHTEKVTRAARRSRRSR